MRVKVSLLPVTLQVLPVRVKVCVSPASASVTVKGGKTVDPAICSSSHVRLKVLETGNTGVSSFKLFTCSTKLALVVPAPSVALDKIGSVMALHWTTQGRS